MTVGSYCERGDLELCGILVFRNQSCVQDGVIVTEFYYLRSYSVLKKDKYTMRLVLKSRLHPRSEDTPE